MEWVKLIASPAYYLDGSLLRAGEAAEVLFCRALAHCGATESEGVVDKTVLPMLVPSKAQVRADALVREGLWIDEGMHYRVRSWDKWQSEHDTAALRKANDRERQRRARQKRLESLREADGSRDTDSVTSRGQSRDPSRDLTTPDREGDREGETQPTTSVGSRRGKPRTRCPEDWPLSREHGQQMAAWALEHAPAVHLGQQTLQWQDYHRAKGDTAADWTASWRTWMRRAQEGTERRPGGVALRGQERPSTSDLRAAQGLALVQHFAEQEGA